jgi:hypothetical protein
LLAVVLTAKYCDHLPLYRLENTFGRQRLEISRSTLCSWIASAYELLTPIIVELRRSVLISRVRSAFPASSGPVCRFYRPGAARSGGTWPQFSRGGRLRRPRN